MRISIASLSSMVVLACAGCPDDPPPAADAGAGPQHEWAPAFDATEIGWLMNVWGPAPDDLYAVGGSPTDGAIVHYDGTSWQPMTLGVSVPLINWIYGFGASDVWAVGKAGTILHYDGASWTKVDPAPTDQELWGVWGAAPNDVWAVGGDGRTDGAQTIVHYDGTSWSVATLPVIVRERVRAFFKVWGSAADDVWVVGQAGVILHWDGSAWSEMGAGTDQDLISVWGTGRDRAVAVGGRGNGVVASWNGTEWTSQSVAPLPGLNGVWMRSPGVAHAVGAEGQILRIDVATLTYEDHYQDTRMTFHAVFGDGEKLVTVGGNLLNTSAPFRGIAYTRPLHAED